MAGWKPATGLNLLPYRLLRRFSASFSAERGVSFSLDYNWLRQILSACLFWQRDRRRGSCRSSRYAECRAKMPFVCRAPVGRVYQWGATWRW
jgi:hypothetical protein